MSMHTGPRERLRYGYASDSATVVSVPGRNTAPHLTVSPRTASGLRTGRIGLVVLAGPVIAAPPAPQTPAEPPAGGFTLNIYRAVPTVGEWAQFAALTGVFLKSQLVIDDIHGGWGLYFSLYNAFVRGPIYMAVAEMP